MQVKQKPPVKLLLFFLSLAFLFRLQHLHNPLLDWHSFRQADTASVTREFFLHDYPLWLPHYHDLGDIQSGLPNPEGYRLVELPVPNYLLAQLLKLIPSWDLVIVSRLASALVSTASVYLLYWLVKKWSGMRAVALASMGFMALLPVGVYFGRAILPEPYQVFFLLVALVGFTLYLKRPQLASWLLTWLGLSLTLLMKPTSVFVLPVFLVLAFQAYGWSAWKKPALWLLAFASLGPLLAWRSFIQQYPAGIPVSDWLFNGDGIRLRPSWWRWLFWERLTKEWLGYTGLIFFCGGFAGEEMALPDANAAKSKIPQFRLTKFDWLTYIWGLGLFVYLVVFATGNVRHDYYQYLLLPWVCLMCGRGLVFFAEKIYAQIYQLISGEAKESAIKTLAQIALIQQVFLPILSRGKGHAAGLRRLTIYYLMIPLLIFLGSAWLFAIRANSGKFNINNWAQAKLGAYAAANLPSDALVIADNIGDTAFLWQSQRRGWPIGTALEEKISAGANYYLSVNRDEMYDYLATKYQLFYEDDQGYIFALDLPLASSAGEISE
jgi:4-amino-4-deoxy-L-arabinose transferase-like glycosyltransferase